MVTMAAAGKSACSRSGLAQRPSASRASACGRANQVNAAPESMSGPDMAKAVSHSTYTPNLKPAIRSPSPYLRLRPLQRPDDTKVYT